MRVDWDEVFDDEPREFTVEEGECAGDWHT